MTGATKTFAGPTFGQDEHRCKRCGIDFRSKTWRLCIDCRDVEKDRLELWVGGKDTE